MGELRWVFNALAWQPQKADLLRALMAISKDERERIQRFHFKEDYKLSLCGRLLIRKAIVRNLDIAWTSIQLGRSAKGKPELSNEQKVDRKFSFNVSHQGAFTALVASTSAQVGVDVMDIARPRNKSVDEFFKLMRRQFSTVEWQHINSFHSEHRQLKEFYRLWCLKESYAKATGTGIGTMSGQSLSFHTSSVDISVDNAVTDSTLCVSGIPSNFRFVEQMLDEDHIVAVASDCYVATDVPFKFFSEKELLMDCVDVCDGDGDLWWSEFQQKKCRELIAL